MRFVALVDDHRKRPADELLVALYPVVCELIYRAALLPDVEPETHGLVAERMSHAEWVNLFRSLEGTLGRHNVYWLVFDPYEHEDENLITGTLADDLADIYRDLDLLQVRSAQNVSNDVVWQWRFGFYEHWGHHAVDVVRATQALIAYHGLGDDERDGWEGEG